MKVDLHKKDGGLSTPPTPKAEAKSKTIEPIREEVKETIAEEPIPFGSLLCTGCGVKL